MIISRLQYEYDLWKNGVKYIGGIDEAGRGPLAGPLVVAGVILNKKHFVDDRNYDIENELLETYSQINDSKKISEKKREFLYDFIINNSISYVIEEIDSSTIDNEGIGVANKIGFFNVATKLKTHAEHYLTDFFDIKGIPNTRQTNIVKGDSKSISIASASILAKVYRDRVMKNYSQIYTEYGFEKHKGYGTLFHRDQIKKLGPCKIHRRSFSLVQTPADTTE